MSNIEILTASINNPEPFLDPYYSKIQASLVISLNKNKPTKLQLANRRIRDCITAIAEAQRHSERSLVEKLIDDIAIALTENGINNSEFTSFWEVNDVSYSIFTSLSHKEKVAFLEKVINLYLENRHTLYSDYGYSDVTLQVKSDSFSHKRSGSQGGNKIKEILKRHGIFCDVNVNCDKYLNNGSSSVIFPDSEHESEFDKILLKLKCPFKWGVDHEGKRPDCMFRVNGKHFIIEHKHMKELGGGQNKQITELINFISHNDSNLNISYIAFMDGILFNRIFKTATDNRTLNQCEAIYEQLKKNSDNYFVNTYGFSLLLSKNISI